MKNKTKYLDFSATFTTINEKQKLVSKMQRYLLIREYSSHGMIPVPLCVIAYPYFVIKYLLSLCIAWIGFENDSHTENGYVETPANDKNEKQNVKMKRLSTSQPKAFGKKSKMITSTFSLNRYIQ